MEFEGSKKGLTRAEAESEVLRYLQRKSLMDEGAMEGDAQDYVTFGLLALVMFGAAYGALHQG
jgi:hypothetical protein